MIQFSVDEWVSERGDLHDYLSTLHLSGDDGVWAIARLDRDDGELRMSLETVEGVYSDVVDYIVQSTGKRLVVDVLVRRFTSKPYSYPCDIPKKIGPSKISRCADLMREERRLRREMEILQRKMK